MQDILRSISTAQVQDVWSDCLYAIKDFNQGVREPLFFPVLFSIVENS